MTRETSRPEYAQRMHRVLERVDRHLDEPLDLARLADVANFSAFHFHRVFSAWMGETLGDYVRRRRLEIAALCLATQPRSSVLNIALSVGFNSAEAFTRAFRIRFGASPSAWRREERKNRRTNRNVDQDAERDTLHHGVTHFTERAAMKVKVVELAPAYVAYLRHIGPYGEQLSRFWQDTVYPWMVTNDPVGKPRYGVSHDDPAITAPEQCRYDACVAVPKDFAGTGSYQTTTLPGGKYAVTRFKGSAALIGDTWVAMLRDWLPESGMQLDARPMFEFYSPEMSFDPKTGAFECDLYVPLKPL